MSEWAQHVRAQIRLIVDQIADMRAIEGGPNSSRESGVSTYFSMLEELIDKDLRLALLRDESDLLLRAEGDAFDGQPQIRLVSAVFSNVTSQVTDLTKAILGVRPDGRLTPKSVDLGLSGIAKGSLYFGLKAQAPDAKLPLLGIHDSLYDSTKKALRIIDEVAHSVESDSEKVSMEEVSEVVEDPRVRDAALVAVQRISPTGRQGIESISVNGPSGRPAYLTPLVRKAIRASLDKPVLKGDEIEFRGEVREIDLDARRFELRGISDHQIRDLRCAYRDMENVSPKKLLGSTVVARGLVERAADDVPRLMSVRHITIVNELSEEIEE